MKHRLSCILALFLAGLILFSCSPKSRYDRKLTHELASGERNDTIFMGIYLGMSDKDFYTHCWTLNREGLIRQGNSNMSVERVLDKELPYPATMNFYPNFGHGKITELPVRFVYNGWSPWTKELSAENLQKDVLAWFKKLYGGGYISVEHPLRGSAFIKLDGNRRITIYTENDMYVWAVFKDMSVMDTPGDSVSGPGGVHEEITKEPAQ